MRHKTETMRYAPLLIIFCLLLSCSGCATAVDRSDYPEEMRIRTRVIEADYDTTFGAVVDILTDFGHAIAEVDKDSGIVTTEYQDFKAGSFDTLSFERNRVKHCVRISSLSKRKTKVTWNVTFEEQKTFGGWTGSPEEREWYNSWFSALQYHVFELGPPPGTIGIGVGVQELTRGEKGNLYEIVDVLEKGPSAKAGIQPGDYIMKVNGDDVRSLKPSQVAKKIKGPPGSKITLTIYRPETDEILDFELTRLSEVPDE